MLLHVVEGVLGDVGDAEVVVDPELAGSFVAGFGLSHDHLDEGTLSRSVGSDDGDATAEGHLHVDVRQGVRLVHRVLEVDISELQEFLGRRADAF